MRINGQEIAREYRVVTIPRTTTDAEGKLVDCSFKLQVHSIPLGLGVEFDKIYPRPLPPKIVTGRMEGGKTVDDVKYNHDDPDYINAFIERESLKLYHKLYHILVLDKSVKFNVTPNDRESLIAFRTEIVESGLSDGDIMLIVSAAAEASNIKAEDIAKARGNF